MGWYGYPKDEVSTGTSRDELHRHVVDLHFDDEAKVVFYEDSGVWVQNGEDLIFCKIEQDETGYWIKPIYDEAGPVPEGLAVMRSKDA